MRNLGKVLFGVLALGLSVTSLPAGAVAPAPTSTSVAADSFLSPPDVLSVTCLNRTDRARMAAARAACDQNAYLLGYSHGVIRPMTPNDLGDEQEIPKLCKGDDYLAVCIGID